MAKKKYATEDRIAGVEEVQSKTIRVIEENQNIITYAVGAIIVVILLFFG